MEMPTLGMLRGTPAAVLLQETSTTINLLQALLGDLQSHFPIPADYPYNQNDFPSKHYKASREHGLRINSIKSILADYLELEIYLKARIGDGTF